MAGDSLLNNQFDKGTQRNVEDLNSTLSRQVTALLGETLKRDPHYANHRMDGILPAFEITGTGFERGAHTLKDVDSKGQSAALPERALYNSNHAEQRHDAASDQQQQQRMERRSEQKESQIEKAAPATLDQHALEVKAESLHDALNKKALWGHGWSSPDKAKVMAELEPLNQADRAALEKVYADKYGQSGGDQLRKELAEKLSKEDASRAEAVLDRKDGKTNDAGNMHMALAKIDEISGKAKSDGFKVDKDDLVGPEKQLRETLSGLNSEQLKRMDQDYRKQYGKGLDQAVAENQDLSPETRAALQVYLKHTPNGDYKGNNGRTSEELVELANAAVKGKNVEMLGEALRGDNDTARRAREAFQQDNAETKLKGAFSGQELTHAKDYAAEGRISLATAAGEDKRHLLTFWHSNKEGITSSVEHASDKERADYQKGRELSLGGKSDLSGADKSAVDYYNKVHNALKDAGNEKQVAVWEDKLLRKNSLISDLAETHSEGWWITPIGKGHNKSDLISKVENMSKEDWSRLKDNSDPSFRRDLESSLKTYASKDEQERIKNLIDEKVKAPSFEESQKVGRSIIEAVNDNKGSKLLGMGEKYDGTRIVDSIENMKEADRKRYSDDAAYRAQVDQAIDKAIPKGPERDLAHRLLNQVAETGGQPKIGPVEKVLQDTVKGEKPDVIVRDLESAMKDPKLRERLNRPDNELTADEQQVKRDFRASLQDALFKTRQCPPDQYTQAEAERYHRIEKGLFDKGQVSLDDKLSLGSSKSGAMQDIINASPEEKERLANPKTEEDKKHRESVLDRFNDEQKQVIEKALQQKDGMSLADKMRSFVAGDGSKYEDLKQDLQKLTNKQKEDLKDEYAAKYGKSLDGDFLSKVDEKDRMAYKDMLTPATVDARQNFYDTLRRSTESQTGAADYLMKHGLWDGSRTELERALDQTASVRGEYAAKFQHVPADKQQELINQYADALDKYKASKGKMSEQVVDAALTAGSLAATVATGGAASPLLIASVAGAGAAFKIGATKVMEGGDFQDDTRSVAKMALSGAFSAGTAFVGPGEFLKVVKYGDKAAASAAESLISELGSKAATEGGETLLKEGAQQIAKNEIVGLSREALVAGRSIAKEELEQVAASVVKEGASQAEKELVAQTLAKHLTTSMETGAKSFVQSTFKNAEHMAVEATLNGSVGAVSGAAGAAATAPLDWDSRRSVSENLADIGSQVKDAAIGGAVGGVAFTGLTHLARGAAHGLKDLAEGAIIKGGVAEPMAGALPLEVKAAGLAGKSEVHVSGTGSALEPPPLPGARAEMEPPPLPSARAASHDATTTSAPNHESSTPMERVSKHETVPTNDSAPSIKASEAEAPAKAAAAEEAKAAKLAESVKSSQSSFSSAHEAGEVMEMKKQLYNVKIRQVTEANGELLPTIENPAGAKVEKGQWVVQRLDEHGNPVLNKEGQLDQWSIKTEKLGKTYNVDPDVLAKGEGIVPTKVDGPPVHMVMLEKDTVIQTPWGPMEGKKGSFLANYDYDPVTGKPGKDFAIVAKDSFNATYETTNAQAAEVLTAKRAHMERVATEVKAPEVKAPDVKAETLSNGASLKRADNGNVMETVDKNGYATRYEYNGTQLNKVIHHDGTELRLSDDGKWEIKGTDGWFDSRARVSIDSNGSYTIDWEKGPNTYFQSVTEHLDGTKEERLVSGGFLKKDASGHVVVAADKAGNLQQYTWEGDKLVGIGTPDNPFNYYRDQDGDWAYKSFGKERKWWADFSVDEFGTRKMERFGDPDGVMASFDHLDGTYEHVYEHGGRIVRASDNRRLLYSTDASGKSVSYTWDGDRLTNVDFYFSGVKASSTDGKTWTIIDRTHPRGGYVVEGKLDVDGYGTRTWQPSGGGKKVVDLLDGRTLEEPAA